ncbi:hypothetical protein DNTS_023973 [Danionella cerebrum]|uniref:Uncharacterized protein n=1 Tax=Danionella cerebrum TaxID=2873325 RepID=A0A553MVA7_9TELE|nr:hypothetical protein DNTS_023973 [Danionella translucida]
MNLYNEQLNKNGESFRKTMEAIFQKYSRLKDPGVDVCLRTMTCMTERGTVPIDSPEGEQQLEALKTKVKADYSCREFEDQENDQMDFSEIYENKSNTSDQKDYIQIGSGEESFHHSLHLNTTGSQRCDLSQPEEEDDELEKTLSSQGNTLLDVYPSMLERINKAYRRQHVTQQARAVVHKYRRKHWQHNANSTTQSPLGGLSQCSDSFSDTHTPNETIKSSVTGLKSLQRDQESALNMVKNKLQSENSSFSACFYSPRSNTVDTSSLAHVSSGNDLHSMRTQEQIPACVIDLTTPPHSRSDLPSSSEHSPDLDQTYDVLPLSPKPNNPSTSIVNQTGVSIISRASLLNKGLMCPSVPSPYCGLIGVSSPKSTLRANILNIGRQLNTSGSSKRRSPDHKVHAEPFRSPYAASRLALASSRRSVHPTPIQDQLYFSPSKRQRSLSGFQNSFTEREVDHQFRKLYHHFICRGTSSACPSSRCPLCDRHNETSLSSSFYSSGMSALALTPLEAKLKKRRRQPEIQESSSFKRFRESLSPMKHVQLSNGSFNSSMFEAPEDKRNWDRGVLLQCPSPFFLRGSGSLRRIREENLRLQKNHALSWGGGGERIKAEAHKQKPFLGKLRNMEPETESNREDKRKRDIAAHWRGEEVKALLVVWRQREAWEEEESRAKYEAISSCLREFGVYKDWLECRAKCRSMALPDWRPSKNMFIHTSTDSGTPTQGSFMGDEELMAARRETSPMPGLQEGLEGGRHWSDKEVRALLAVWADKEVHNQLQRTPRNKAIFQEMAHRLERQHGVLRDWRQCRTKYKNMKYDYKVSKSEGRPIRFFAELDALMQGKQPVIEQIIKIDDDESLAEMQTMIKGATHPLITPTSAASVNEMNVITVHDSGRNWSEEEVAALLEIWAEEGIQQQLQGSTRNKDIFVQISRRLLQQGVERDWKQCRTKYKNLKYLYRSLQRGKADIGDPRRVMRYYEQLDSLLAKPQRNRMSYAELSKTNSLPRGPRMFAPSTFEEPAEDGNIVAFRYEEPSMDEGTMGSSAISARVFQNQAENQGILQRQEEESNVEYGIADVDSTIVRPTTSPEMEYEQQLSSDSITDIYNDSIMFRRIPAINLTQEESMCHPQQGEKGKQQMKSPDDGESSTDWSENIDFQCKDEEDQYIPITDISSVCTVSSNAITSEQTVKRTTTMSNATELKLGQKLNEGKTKQIFEIVNEPGHVLVQSKDQITAGNAVRKDQMEGKAAIANNTTSSVFKLLQNAGLKTAFVRQHSETAFVASRCEMIPIEWVCRRIATGSFLKRNPGVKEGYRFTPLKMEMFFKDDANNDPQWSEEQLLAAGFEMGGLTIGRCEVDIMSKSTVAIFEVLEKAWATQDCTLVDMKVYRDLKEVTPEAMQMVKRNFEWVAERVKLLLEPESKGRVVVLMGSTSDAAHCDKIRKACALYGIPCHLRVNSAHKGPDETLRIKEEYEGDGVPTIFVAVAGRSNGLGPVMSGNTAYPVINCPPITPDWGAQDIWSSLRMPSGLGCSTVLSPEAAAQFAAQILGLNDHLVWARLRASMLNTWISLKMADKKMQECSL